MEKNFYYNHAVQINQVNVLTYLRPIFLSRRIQSIDLHFLYGENIDLGQVRESALNNA